MSPTWSIITVTYNSAQDLRTYWSKEQLPSDIEWIVVDNASTDESIEQAKQLGATQSIPLSKNAGFSHANNIGAAAATGEYLLFANPDLTINFTDLETMAVDLSENDGISAPQLVNPDGSLQPNGRGLPTVTNKIANRLPGYQGDYYITCLPGETKYVCFAMGAALAVRASSFERIGGWNERYFIYYEDSDICLRAWSEDSVRVVGDVRWVHGWQRETTRVSFRAWRNELSSASKFYSLFPHFIVSRFPKPARYDRMLSQSGTRMS